jgi:hypothetical protein
MNDKVEIICARAYSIKPLVACKIGSCDECTAQIYIGLSTPVIEGARYICLQCVDWESIDKLEEPTKKQKEEMIKFFKSVE